MSTQGVREQAARDAATVLTEWWNEDYYPVDPFNIAKQMDVIVFRGDLPDNVSGMIRMHEHRVEMYVDTDESPRRQRFTAAHELGHLVQRLQRGDLEEGKVLVDRRGVRAALGHDPDEIYANEFAACLLMPAPAVRRLARQRMQAWEIARFFDVSPTSVDIRLQNLGMA